MVEGHLFPMRAHDRIHHIPKEEIHTCFGYAKDADKYSAGYTTEKTAGAKNAPRTLNYEGLTISMTLKQTRTESSECNHITTGGNTHGHYDNNEFLAKR